MFAWPSYILLVLGSACVKKTVQCICSMHLMGHLQHGMFLLFTRTTTASSKNRKYFASSDPHHDISKQLVDTTFV